jgi:type II secretory pathway pseudopilin PulG
MRKSSSDFFDEKGITLIEIVASFTILFILIISFLSLFIQSSQSNSLSKKIMSATYVAEAQMEIVRNSITTTSLTSLNSLSIPTSSTSSSNGSSIPNYNITSNGCSTGFTCYENTYVTGHYVFLQLKVDSTTSLVDAILKVYSDSSKANLEAQMESYLSWKQQ